MALKGVQVAGRGGGRREEDRRAAGAEGAAGWAQGQDASMGFSAFRRLSVQL